MLRSMFCSSRVRKYKIYDMHSRKELDCADTMDEAIRQIMVNIKQNNPSRCYEIYEGSIEKNKCVWYGDSWDVGQYLRENHDVVNQGEIAELNARRIFGSNAQFNPTKDPDVLDVTYNKGPAK